MAKSKLKTPDWVLEGYDSPSAYAKAKGGKSSPEKKDKKESKEDGKDKGKKFKIKVCPKCGSDDVAITLSNLDFEEESNTGKQWECKKCKWKGTEIKEKNLTEDELMEHLDKRGEEVA
jgi:DNA-directed RNA polymerase subunit M/transcription elongation factor TFIIS